MLQNAIQHFMDSLFLFLAGRVLNFKGLLVKKHASNMVTCGEFSFPGTMKSWEKHIESSQNSVSHDVDDRILSFIAKTPDDIIECSNTWKLHVKCVKEEVDRVYLFIDRPKALFLGLFEAKGNILFVAEKLQSHRTSLNLSNVTLDPICCKNDCLTTMRAKIVCKVVENLCAIKFNQDEVLPEVFVTTLNSSTYSRFKIFCNSVVNVQTGKKDLDFSPDDFISSRQIQMMDIAQHRFAVGQITHPHLKEFTSHFGESTAAFELLQVKPSSVVTVNHNFMTGGNSRGVPFIFYNNARLETMIKKYKDEVEKGVYPPLPDITEVDFSLLTQEDEWTLIFNFVMGFPSMLENCIEFTDDKCDFKPHMLCSFLNSLVSVFSQYYRKTRILVEPRSHLLPTIHARVHFLIILNDILKICLKILNIRCVERM